MTTLTTAIKQPSKAWTKAQEYRDMMHKGDCKILCKKFSSVVYLSSNKDSGAVYATGYKGRGKKPAFNYIFKDNKQRMKFICDWMGKIAARSNERRKPSERALQVGDVLKSVWGYEQTNIDYYLVKNLVGKQSVEIVEIGAKALETGWLQGKCIPNKEHIIGEPMTKRADGESVRLTSFSSASKIEPKIVAGAEVWDTDHYTSYH